VIDIATPDDSNLNTTETETLSKSKDLKIEASRMWELRTATIGAFGTILRVFDQNVQLLPGHPPAIQLQKFTPVSTAHTTSFVNCWCQLL
jgi:hypothetical protein